MSVLFVAAIIFLCGESLLLAGIPASVEWDVPAPREDILASYAPEKEAGALNFYGYAPMKSRQIAQTLVIKGETRSVAIEALVLRLGRSLPAGRNQYDIRIDFHEIDSPTSSDLDPTLEEPVASVRAALQSGSGDGDEGSYFRIVFDEPVFLETYPGYPAFYAVVVAFTEYGPDQQLLLSFGKNIPGSRLMENTEGCGWMYVGGNPSLFYFLQGKPVTRTAMNR